MTSPCSASWMPSSASSGNSEALPACPVTPTAEGAQHDAPPVDLGPVHQDLVVGVAGAQDHRAAVLPIPDPLVYLQQDGRVGPVLARAGAGNVIQDDVVLGELPLIIVPERPVAEGLAARHLSEDAAHVAHGPTQLGRPDVAPVELRSAPDVLPVNGDQNALGLLAHEVGSRANGVWVPDPVRLRASPLMICRRHQVSASRGAGTPSRDRERHVGHRQPARLVNAGGMDAAGPVA